MEFNCMRMLKFMHVLCRCPTTSAVTYFHTKVRPRGRDRAARAGPPFWIQSMTAMQLDVILFSDSLAGVR